MPAAKIRQKTPPCRKRISDEVGNQMFLLWCEVKHAGGYKAVAGQYGYRPASIRAYAKRHDWVAREKQVQKKAAEKTEKTAAQRRAEKVIMAAGLANAALGGLFIEDEKGHQVLRRDPSISDAIRAMDFEDTLRERTPDQADEAASTMTPDEVRAALGAMKGLGAAGLRALGKLVVEMAENSDKAKRQNR